MLRSMLVLALAGGATAGPLRMSDGRDYPEACVHWLAEGDRIESLSGGRGDMLVRGSDGSRTELPPCPEPRGERTVLRGGDGASSGYYSDWIIDTVSVHDNIGTMISSWTVPKEPASRGPVPGMSSAYLFNGLEDGGGQAGKASLILQPVLSHGKSGCVLNPLAGWRFTAFQVTAAGRAYCGKSISVDEGDVLQGRMELVAKGQWKVTADAGSKGKSEHLVSTDTVFNAAYLTLEGMVVYNCGALPGGSVTFTANSLTDAAGRALTPSWRTQARHTECTPQAAVATDGAVELSWKTAVEALVV